MPIMYPVEVASPTYSMFHWAWVYQVCSVIGQWQHTTTSVFIFIVFIASFYFLTCNCNLTEQQSIALFLLTGGPTFPTSPGSPPGPGGPCSKSHLRYSIPAQFLIKSNKIWYKHINTYKHKQITYGGSIRPNTLKRQIYSMTQCDI